MVLTYAITVRPKGDDMCESETKLAQKAVVVTHL